jgi:hypothetical protein
MKGKGRGVLHNLWVHWVPHDFQTGEVHVLCVAFFAFYCHRLKERENILLKCMPAPVECTTLYSQVSQNMSSSYIPLSGQYSPPLSAVLKLEYSKPLISHFTLLDCLGFGLIPIDTKNLFSICFTFSET